MRVAIQGCCHGELDVLYGTLKEQAIDLLIICGDFQCLRSHIDLPSLACPPKYRKLGNFYEYYSGLKSAPFPTLFIGGNHEASSYLWELFHGGFVAENIYFLGFAGVINFGGLRIGGVSGIYKAHHYNLGYYEKHPLSEQDCRSIYHTRRFNTYRLSLIKENLDIFLSHDWPRGISYHGNLQKLIKNKPFFREEIYNNTLGSPANEILLKLLKPKYWFSAHLHVKFVADYRHSDKVVNPDEILLDEDLEISQDDQESITHFLALDKILPGREFYEIYDIPIKSDKPLKFAYDEEWLAIVHATNEYMTLESVQKELPDASLLAQKIIASKEEIRTRIAEKGLNVPPFIMTASAYRDSSDFEDEPFTTFINPQTSYFCDLLGIKNCINPDGQVVNYGDPERLLKRVLHWNTDDYDGNQTLQDNQNGQGDGYV